MKLSTILKIILINLKIIFKRTFYKIDQPTPYKLLIQLTNNCNSKCSLCNIWQINKINPKLADLELTPNDYVPLLTEYGTSLYWIALSGGEISLYKDINELILIFSKYCPNLTLITFTTNGLLPNQILSIGLEIKEKLPRCDFFVTISLDGDESLHDNIRGVPGNFKLANETLELLTKNKIKSHFGLTLSQLNMHHFKDDISLLQFNPKAISLVHDEGIYQTKLQFDNLELQGIIKQLIINYKIIHLGELIEYFFLKIAQKFLENNRKKNIIPCEVINTSLHLTPYGDVKPCMYLPSLGNIKNKSILNILHSKETNDSLQEIKKNHCPKCWMNCYAPHSMMLHPIKTIQEVLWK